ncbi:hypothetical protein H2200_002275 [Cladophialophora chaetospira]|uniref:Uncharacterized protein n=1 Tax=Cladophialophora chaetospira TaxID=386627 RepID=A0AA39CMX0_9EURO|nr:hypothetical protein H2200_002275 [Cladophialophora chaetospira]
MSSTANPRAPKPEDVGIAQEPTGPVAADSLAAESLQDKGGFSENTNAEALGVKGNQSTLNTTDTSGATALPAARDAEEREKQDALGQGSDVKGVSGLKYPDGVEKAEFAGHHSDTGAYSGGPSNTGSSGGQASSAGAPAGSSDFGASTISSSTGGPDESQIRSGDAATKDASSSAGGAADTGSSGSSGPAAGTGVRPLVDAAPGYVGGVTGNAYSEGTFKPKGKNLEDADQTESMPKPKTFTGAIGTVNDPGRLAERDFEGANNDPIGELGQAGEEGGRARQQGGESQGGDKGQYGVLESERA